MAKIRGTFIASTIAGPREIPYYDVFVWRDHRFFVHTWEAFGLKSGYRVSHEESGKWLGIPGQRFIKAARELAIAKLEKNPKESLRTLRAASRKARKGMWAREGIWVMQ